MCLVTSPQYMAAPPAFWIAAWGADHLVGVLLNEDVFPPNLSLASRHLGDDCL